MRNLLLVVFTWIVAFLIACVILFCIAVEFSSRLLQRVEKLIVAYTVCVLVNFFIVIKITGVIC